VPVLPSFLLFPDLPRPRWPLALQPVVLGVLALLCGAASAQASDPLTLRASPLLAEKPPAKVGAATTVYGERASGRVGLEAVLEGQAEMRQPGTVARAERLRYDQGEDTVTVSGDVRLNQAGDRYTAESGQLRVDAVEGFLLRPTYQFLASGAHGEATRLEWLDQDRASLLRATYTTCVRGGPDWVPDWVLRADRLDIDREDDEGRAAGAVLEFKGVPILPVPVLSFPVSERRRSGWLPPTLGLDNKSGLDLSVPYYWNIAPNRDATFTPGLMSRRGVDLAGEFRYLESGYQGRVNANLTPNDRLRDGRNRWGYFLRHNGRHDTGIDAVGAVGLGLNLNRVSDDDYWRDFTRRGLSLTTRLLANDGALSWSSGDVSLNARALKWQTLQDVAAPIVPPYDRLPQLSGRWARTNDRGFDYAVDADFTRFRADPFWTRQPNADRGFVQAQLAHPFTRPWGFFTPRVQLHASHYRFDRPIPGGATSAARALPTVSLDGGLVFEREARFFGRDFTQTLEPRLKYVYTPYRDQGRLPLYDTGAYDFNFATIWAENAFAGNDRIVDNNLVTGGLTPPPPAPRTGAAARRPGPAPRARFSAPPGTPPGGPPTPRGVSGPTLGASPRRGPRRALDTPAPDNPAPRPPPRTTVQARYSPEKFHTVSAAYRHQRDLRSESLDVGWQWPLADLVGRHGELGASRASAGGSCNGRWYGVGRMNYSLQDKRLVEGLLGFEYDAGCWIGRVVLEKLNSSISTSTKRIMFQIEFIGLSRLGSNPMRTLRNNIPRYQYLREETSSPSRFTDYE